ncbi:hypothetical protein [Bacillus cereus]|uniref:hypothetical protein n=1 Tax=Bacillus cereus TaxID=1396 RepID=UPI000BECEB30|nr:hypothetical protein [Bacillus cereus]PDY76977.1 hypothetical protein CON06_27820 [Bacillus cereus]
MSINEVAKGVQAIRLAEKEHGILSVRGREVHLTHEVFESLLFESKTKPLITPRDSKDYPYEVSFINENVIYFSLYTLERMKNKIGGYIDELITSN